MIPFIRTELADAYLESTENHDGHGGKPADPRSYELAADFLKGLPLGTNVPSATVDPDAMMSLEWYEGPRRSLVISFEAPTTDHDGKLHWAALIGSESTCGTASYGGQPPSIILKVLAQLA